MSDYLTQQETERLVYELIDLSPDGGMYEDDVKAAVEAVNDLALSAAMLELWREHRMRFSWRNGELIMHKV